MRFHPLPIFALVGIFSITYILYTNKLSFPNNLFLETEYKSHSAFLEQNEAIRMRFLKKREEYLVRGRSLSGEIGLWDNFDGATTIWNYFPPTFTCPHFLERIGTPGDGGKWMCGVNLFEDLNRECIMYSFGVARESTMELEILERTSCSIYAYDPTVSSMNLGNLSPDKKSRVHFFQQGLSGWDNDSSSIHTLGHFMRRNNHKYIDFLKIDIEGAEYPAFQQMGDEFKDSFPFGHLNVELHLTGSTMLHGSYTNDEKGEFSKFYDIFTCLEAGGLRAFTWEDNHFPGLNKMKPILMEYAFINVNNTNNQLIYKRI